ncbi:MAG: hypothetical protein A3F11_10620 [Gammaproteobacteria bacterium RIFCSPHIGHO2_12_FULL_37_14]|nr:MAG: hypothetical protein A3F11_10620 [Gammaproteobacteria bacterium RIFCSPHIGHO2_12_FULL_37_14]
MAQSAKCFAERLNNCLDETNAPFQMRERAAILSKLFDIPKSTAWNLLEGHQLPEPDLLQKIAKEFDVESNWLSGEK